MRKLPWLSLLLASFTLSLCAQKGARVNSAIRLNQLGYYPDAPKIAVVTGEVSSNRFYITSSNLRDTFFSGVLGGVRQSRYSSTKTRLADFSGFSQKGSYVVLLPGVGHSYPFQIREAAFRELGAATLKGFYFQRVSMPLEPRYAGKWHRSAGHPDTAVQVHSSAASKGRPAGTRISSPRGWYDAGDYNKYIVNSGITMGTLLSAYEDFPDYFKSLGLAIPESGDGVPDILDEALYNLRWMLTMQDGEDGGVYHKCTNAAFDGMVMPGVTREPRYVVQKSTAAALDFAAVTAQAARILKAFPKPLPGLADSCLQASKKAWAWAEKNPLVYYDQGALNAAFDPDITTGDYGDKNLKDEWLWAAAELWVTTKDAAYLSVLSARMKDAVRLPSWSSVGLLGYYTVLRQERHKASLPGAVVKAMKDSLLLMADDYLAGAASSAFATVMGQSEKDFVWGSNAVAANQGILLIQAFLVAGDKKYLHGALSNLDYIMGRNATGYSFVTGYGSKTPMHPHHRPSEADGVVEPVPGLLTGGPNPGMQDKCTYPFKEPETAYVDDVCSYASNEIAINWNAPIAYLANALEALRMK